MFVVSYIDFIHNLPRSGVINEASQPDIWVVLDASHGLKGLILTKLIKISLTWIHMDCLMPSWTNLGASFTSNSPKSA
jgi:hypothetical protein